MDRSNELSSDASLPIPDSAEQPGITAVLPLRRDALSPTVAPAMAGSGTAWRPSAPSAWQAGIFALLVAALGFLLASFPARNSDIWLHLARGRALLTGGQFHQGWLFDVVCYGLYAAFGGTGLALFKAALTAGIALIILRISRVARQGWWIPAFCTALAVLAMGIRLLLQPAIISDFLFVLMLYFLYTRKEFSASLLRSVLHAWPLFVLFVVWVNTDDWFVLGLAVAGLIWLGQVLDALRRSEPTIAALSVMLLVRWVVLVGVCLLNPFHVHAFAWPAELSWLPYTTYLAERGLSPAGLAYCPLLVLSLVSFLLNFPRARWQWFLPWVVLAALSALDMRAVPFFAALAGPVLAWNLEGFLTNRLESDPRRAAAWRGGLLLGRAL